MTVIASCETPGLHERLEGALEQLVGDAAVEAGDDDADRAARAARGALEHRVAVRNVDFSTHVLDARHRPAACPRSHRPTGRRASPRTDRRLPRFPRPTPRWDPCPRRPVRSWIRVSSSGLSSTGGSSSTGGVSSLGWSSISLTRPPVRIRGSSDPDGAGDDRAYPAWCSDSAGFRYEVRLRSAPARPRSARSRRSRSSSSDCW